MALSANHAVSRLSTSIFAYNTSSGHVTEMFNYTVKVEVAVLGSSSLIVLKSLWT